MPPGAARNALDCALLDLEAKTSGQRVWDLLGRPAPRACITAYTISLGSPEAMAAATAKAAHRPLLKIKLGGDGDGERIAAVRKAAPKSELIVDANEAWTSDNLEQNLADLRARPASRWSSSRFPPARMRRWRASARPIAVCADESVHDRGSLDGTSRALRCRQYQARQDRRVDGGACDGGCGARARVSRSWSAAWSRLRWRWRRQCCSRQQARFVDLDGPLLLARDRDGGLRYDGSLVYPPEAALWG